MNKKYFKGITGLVSTALLISTISTAAPSIANAENQDGNGGNTELVVIKNSQGLKQTERNNKLIKIGDSYRALESLTLEDFKSLEDIPQELLDPNFYSSDEIIYIPESYLDPYHPDAIGVEYGIGNTNDGQPQTFAIAAAAGVYVIPGIGQIALTVTGALVVGGVTIAAGSWLYNQVSTYFAKKAAEDAADDIPNSLKSGDTKVDLGSLKINMVKLLKKQLPMDHLLMGIGVLKKIQQVT